MTLAMHKRTSRIGRLTHGMVVLATATACFVAQAAHAQSVLRDAETEALLHDASAPLIAAAGLAPSNAQVLVIGDPDINAFVAGGQIVWLHSGLLAEADNINQVQGVIAHELGHIEGGHIIRTSEGVKEATGVTLLSMVLGAAAMAAGGGEAGMGIMAAGQQAAMGKFLAFSRTQESSADAAGARYLAKAGISGRGSLEFFRKLQNMEFRLNPGASDSYGGTHPLSTQRISVLTDVYEADPAWDRPVDPRLEARFERVKAKLVGFVSDPAVTLRKYPPSDTSIPARYARAYAYHKGAYSERALEEVDALLAGLPDDPYFLEVKGQILLESGRPAEAIAPLRKAVAQTGGNPLIASMFGHALVATEDNSHLAEAERVLRASLSRDRDNPFAWFVLGNVYARQGDVARAALASAEQASLARQYGEAVRHANRALATLKAGTADYLRAQDIKLASRAEMERAADKGKRKRDGKSGDKQEQDN